MQTAFYQHNLTFSQLDGINEDGLPLIEKGIREGDNWQYKINRGKKKKVQKNYLIVSIF